MDSVFAIFLFLLASVLLVAIMAGGGKSSGRKGNDTGKPKPSGSTSRHETNTTSIEHLATAPPRRAYSVSPARGGHARRTNLLEGFHGPNVPPPDSPQNNRNASASGSSPTPLAGGSGASVNRARGGSRSGSPPVRKRGRDEARGLELSMPINRGPNTGVIPPPLKQAAAAPHAAEGEHMFICSLCPKGFVTSKGLCGHMRAHPERSWRGAHPPPVFDRAEFENVADIIGGSTNSVSAGGSSKVALSQVVEMPERLVPSADGHTLDPNTAVGSSAGVEVPLPQADHTPPNRPMKETAVSDDGAIKECVLSGLKEGENEEEKPLLPDLNLVPAAELDEE